MTAAHENPGIFDCPLDGMSLIEASAGTGKTWHICALYLRLLLEAKHTVPEILVVTFTTAATAELKDRIRRRIADTLLFLETSNPGAQKTQIEADPFLGLLQDWIQKTGQHAQNLRRILHAARTGFDEAAIFTIHSFCQKILTSKAFSAGLGFSAVVEPDDVEIISEVANDFWRRHIASGEFPRALLTYMDAKNVTPQLFRDFLLREFKKPLAQKHWPEGIEDKLPENFPALDAAFHALRTCWQDEQGTIHKLLDDAITNRAINGNTHSATRIGNALREYESLFRDGDALAAAITEGSNRENLLALLTKSGLEKGTNKKGITPTHAFFERAENWMAARTTALEKLETAYKGILRRLQDETKEARKRKQQRRVISYDDMLYNLYTALTDGTFPKLPQSIRNLYPAALIDEFQDTDPVQFSIFDAIYANTALPVFLVGDPKQAIYSFRNADLHTYLTAKKTVSHHYSLTRNQRSTPRLIAACNTLFSRHARTFMLDGLDYLPVSAGGRTRETLTDETLSEKKADGMILWHLPGGQNGAYLLRKEALQACADATANEIRHLLAAARRGEIRIGEKKLAASDIAILVRSHRESRIIQETLAGYGIASASLGQESVWISSDATDLFLILSAILQPGNSACMRAALATETLGLDSSAIARLAENDDEELAWIERFMQYLLVWQNRGIAYLLRQLMPELEIASRMLSRPDGERRLTNFLHLAELLGDAAQTHTTPEALIRWFDRQREDGKAGEDAQLRLESDKQLVHILTIHRAKGLEFPFVFCPFLWDAYERTESGALPGVTYHDGEKLVIDFREPDEEKTRFVRQQNRMEKAAEDIRLLYVALTRAVFRCYVAVGCYASQTGGAPSLHESSRGLLNWLVAGGDDSPQDWLDRGTEKIAAEAKKQIAAKRLAAIDAAWLALDKEDNGITLKPLPQADLSKETPLPLTDENALPELKTMRLPRVISHGWHIGSYSALTRDTAHETTGSDHDELAQDSLPDEETETGLSPDDILLFPARRYAGNCLHTVFEQADFTDERTWDNAIENALRQHPPYGRANPENGKSTEELKRMIRRMLVDVLQTPMQNGVQLNRIGMDRRLTELAFLLPSKHLRSKALYDLISPHYALPRLDFPPLEGYLKGFIDLVIEHAGRFYILDWKSNLLGMRQADYGENTLSRAMTSNSYHLQYLLYTLALDRYLTQRLTDYDYDRHMGGVFYLFVRGVRPAWRMENGNPCGVYFHRADASLVAALNRLFETGGQP